VHSLRFYREYFKPASEREVEKDRFRYLVKFEGEEFFINVDHMIRPETGQYLEIKSRTWSRQDAEDKSALVTKLVSFLGADPGKAITSDYIDISRVKDSIS
jgi:5-methylthioadenosine/S-adenosylhomocysteine deaminase